MIRPMTSDVSALSGIVANGQQAIQVVSSAPSKIPYGGFSPVRLQAGCQERPSPLPGGFDASTVEISPRRVWFRSGTCVQAARLGSDTTHLPSGPWLRQRLYCPPASSLTMATSALLSARRRFHRLLSAALLTLRRSPIYSARPLRACRGPYAGGSRDCLGRSFHRGLGLRPFSRGSATTLSTHRIRRGSLTTLQPSLYAAARSLACPAPDGTFTTELSCVGSPFHTSVITT